MIRLRDSKEILHTLRNYLLHNLHKTWPLARPGAQAVRVFPIYFRFVFHFSFLFYLRGFFLVCVVSFLFAWFLNFVCVVSFFFACFLFSLLVFFFVCAVFFFVCVVSFFVCVVSFLFAACPLSGHRIEFLREVSHAEKRAPVSDWWLH